METKQLTDSESFAVLEMPVGLKSIRMEVRELRRLCRKHDLPLFTLKVEEQVAQGVAVPLEHPWRKIFTLKWDWCLWAAEKPAEKGGEITRRIEGQRNDGTVVIV